MIILLNDNQLLNSKSGENCKILNEIVIKYQTNFCQSNNFNFIKIAELVLVTKELLSRENYHTIKKRKIEQ